MMTPNYFSNNIFSNCSSEHILFSKLNFLLHAILLKDSVLHGLFPSVGTYSFINSYLWNRLCTQCTVKH